MDEEVVVAQFVKVWRSRVSGDPRAQLAEWRAREPDKEHRVDFDSPSRQRVFLALVELFGIEPYRRPKMKLSTACMAAPSGFVRECFGPLLNDLFQIIDEHERNTTKRLLERWVEDIVKAG